MTTLLLRRVGFDPRERRDRNGRWTDTGGGDGGSLPGPAAALLAGEQVTVSAGQVDGLMKTLAGARPANLKRLQIAGEKNLYRRHVREIPRSRMPQIGAGQMRAFGDALAERGITGRLEEVDPRSLTATQNQLDSAKVAQMYAKIKAGTFDNRPVAFVARDGAVLDGHHRWAANAAARVTGTELTMKVIRLDADIDTLLDIANQVSGEREVAPA
jgi:hypothetical protein